MKIKSAEFVRGVTGEDEILHDGVPQVAFIGRSNVGKSSVINSLTRGGLARSSNVPGKTREINIFHINKDFYLVDLPGYGFAQGSHEDRNQLWRMIMWYLFSGLPHKKIVLIVDAVVGPTEQDLEVLGRLAKSQKDFVVVVNKIDKLKKGLLSKQLKAIQDEVGNHKIIPYSAEKKIGVNELMLEIIV
jgi:GTP-binding protein